MGSKSLVAAALAVALAGCSGSEEPGEPRGGLVVGVSALVSGALIERVTISASPGSHSATLTFNPADGQYRGSLMLPVGTYDVVANAWTVDANGDGALDLAGTGMASVVIFENVTTAAFIRILDVTGPPPLPDHAPVITALTSSSTSVNIGGTLVLAVAARDVDGDAITYAWTESCPSGVPSAFTNPSGATTEWTPAEAGVCTLRIDATANGKTDTAFIDLPVYSGAAPEGSLQVTAAFVSHPYVNYVEIAGVDASGTSFDWVGSRTGAEATLRNDIPAGGAVNVYGGADATLPGNVLTMADDCGGTFSGVWVNTGNTGGTWTAPTAPALCVLTVTLTRDGLTDTFPIAINVQ